MTHEIHLRDEFGPRLSDGSEAYRFRVSKIDSYKDLAEASRKAEAQVMGDLRAACFAAIQHRAFRGEF